MEQHNEMAIIYTSSSSLMRIWDRQFIRGFRNGFVERHPNRGFTYAGRCFFCAAHFSGSPPGWSVVRFLFLGWAVIEVLTYTLFNFSSPSPPIVSSSRSVTNQHNSCGAICVVAALGSSQLIHAASVYQHRLSALASAACKDNTWYQVFNNNSHLFVFVGRWHLGSQNKKMDTRIYSIQYEVSIWYII